MSITNINFVYNNTSSSQLNDYDISPGTIYFSKDGTIILDTPALDSERIVVGSADNIQSDWNQQNENEPDYIKNKPFGTMLNRDINMTQSIGRGQDNQIYASSLFSGFSMVDSVTGLQYFLQIRNGQFEISQAQANILIARPPTNRVYEIGSYDVLDFSGMEIYFIDSNNNAIQLTQDQYKIIPTDDITKYKVIYQHDGINYITDIPPFIFTDFNPEWSLVNFTYDTQTNNEVINYSLTGWTPKQSDGSLDTNATDCIIPNNSLISV